MALSIFFITTLIMSLYLTAHSVGIAQASVVPSGPSFPSLAGCRRALPEGQSAGKVSNVTISSGGHHRNYLISIPPSYRADILTPAILSYHGGQRTAEDQLQLDQLTNPEFNSVSFVIYPQGINVWDSCCILSAMFKEC